MKAFIFSILVILLAATAGASPIKQTFSITADTVPQQKKEVKEQKGNGNHQTEPKGKTIKEVPKAKNQAKPKTITTPGVKMHPVKVIKPKISGKGLGR